MQDKEFIQRLWHAAHDATEFLRALKEGTLEDADWPVIDDLIVDFEDNVAPEAEQQGIKP